MWAVLSLAVETEWLRLVVPHAIDRLKLAARRVERPWEKERYCLGSTPILIDRTRSGHGLVGDDVPQALSDGQPACDGENEATR
jgi:hypothetical protein